MFNTSLDLRNRYGDNLMSCFDRRVVTRTKSCGKQCSVHSIGLVVYTNSVLFLTCVAYLLFSGHCNIFGEKFGLTGQLIVLKGLVVLLGVALCVPFFLRDVEANLFTIGGIFLSVLYLTVTLHDSLNFPAWDAGNPQTVSKRTPHPLTICLLVNLQLLFPAFGVLIGTAGYARDLWVVLSIVVTLCLMGMALQVSLSSLAPFFPFFFLIFSCVQRFVWTFWYVNEREAESRTDEIFNEIIMTVCYLVLWTLFMLLFIAYYNESSMYNLGSVWMFIFFMVYLFCMLAMAIYDSIVYRSIAYQMADPSFHFSVYQQVMFLLTVAFNVFVSLTAIMDVFNHPVVYTD